MADLIRGTTPSYIVDFTDSGVNVVDITKATLTPKIDLEGNVHDA